MTTSLASGYVLYDGPSTINGAPIVAILTTRSTNMKTGNIPQLWILPAGEEPHVAVKTGGDVAVCAGCPHRPLREGSCYVTVNRAPLTVYRQWAAGKYPPADAVTLRRVLQRLSPRAVRLGAWGDPAALPWDAVGAPLLEVCRSLDVAVLGYTHRWRLPSARPWRAVCMASVDSPGEQLLATAAGWRTFRVRLAGETLAADETACPAEADGMTCNACRACDGMTGEGKASPAVHVHGLAYKVGAFRRLRSQRGDR
jgi:hypothetical protein